MLIITFPSNFIPERTYIIDVLFGEFLGVEYKTEIISGFYDYKIALENGNILIIKDHFFSKFDDENGHLDEKNIPFYVPFVENPFILEDSIPVIYGDDAFLVAENTIICGVDIFASSFFMLSRWEEYVNKTRDLHNRFPAKFSLAYKNNFLHRPVVNEYLEMLWNMLEHLGMKQPRKERKFELILTHDVDEIRLWKSWKQVCIVAGGDIFKRRNLRSAFERLSNYYLMNRNKINDPYDTFDWLMGKSEAREVKSRFYFMSSGVTQYDNNYRIDDPKMINLIKAIKERGHIIGIHPSYESYNNYEQWHREKEKLERITGIAITEGRQHYLRFEVPHTWQIWEDNHMKIDSTCGYPEMAGFRCGVCCAYSVFNVLTRKKLNLKEMPLIAMEVSYEHYQNYSPQEMEKEMVILLDRVYRFSGNYVLLWHNTNFNVGKWQKYRYLYEKIIGACRNF